MRHVSAEATLLFQTLRPEVPPALRCKLTEERFVDSGPLLVTFNFPDASASFRCLDAHIIDFCTALCLTNRL